jgi:DNA-binding SARP family transcriptional activator
MLAESTVCVSRGDPAQARARALAACALADAAALLRHQAWACWQLGVLAAMDGQADDAHVHFARAAGLADRHGDPQLATFMTEAERLARSVQEIGREREALQQVYYSLEAAEQAARQHLLAHAAVPRDELQTFVGVYGWSAAPSVLKLASASPPHAAPTEPTGGPSPPEFPGPRWWARMRRVLLLGRNVGSQPGEAGEAEPRVPQPPDLAARQNGPGPAAAAPAGGQAQPASSPPAQMAGPRVTADLRAGRGAGSLEAAATLTVHLLGTTRVALNDMPVTAWPSRRGRALFQYLVVHRDPWASREVLMEAFWPGARPDAARNSLNVAVHGLRRALRNAADVPVVVLDGGAYRLHPEIRLWLDVDEFERHVQCGRKLNEAGDLTAAMAEYELAVSLYQGDFLADDPYEEWPVLSRERLRLGWLDTLDQLSHLYFGRAQYAACANLCQKILDRDACREDAHRRLMRCYARQGQPHLALRQYQTCVEALCDQLGVQPAPATVALDELIRNHEPL